MKTLMSVAVLSASLMAVWAQDVFVLGGPGSTVVPPIVYQPPIVAGAPAASYYTCQPAHVPVAPVCGAYAAPACRDYSGHYSYNYNPNVIYIGGPGAGGPNYYDYPRCSSPNVIYFGREQASRHGYNFRHCR